MLYLHLQAQIYGVGQYALVEFNIHIVVACNHLVVSGIEQKRQFIGVFRKIIRLIGALTVIEQQRIVPLLFGVFFDVVNGIEQIYEPTEIVGERVYDGVRFDKGARYVAHKRRKAIRHPVYAVALGFFQNVERCKTVFHHLIYFGQAF